MIPIPPSHWVKLRQKRMPRPALSMSVITEAPVVVKPEADSKRASTGEVKVSVSR
nr:hypothetical protein [Hydrogenophaga sp.]